MGRQRGRPVGRECVKRSVSLTINQIEFLENLAVDGDLTFSAALRECINYYSWVKRCQELGIQEKEAPTSATS